MKRKDCLMNRLGCQDFLTALIFLNSVKSENVFHSDRRIWNCLGKLNIHGFLFWLKSVSRRIQEKNLNFKPQD